MEDLLKRVAEYMESKETVETMPKLYVDVLDAIEYIQIYEMVQERKCDDTVTHSEEQLKNLISF